MPRAARLMALGVAPMRSLQSVYGWWSEESFPTMRDGDILRILRVAVAASPPRKQARLRAQQPSHRRPRSPRPRWRAPAPPRASGPSRDAVPREQLGSGGTEGGAEALYRDAKEVSHGLGQRLYEEQ